MQQMITCLWFDRQAEEAARFYTSVFKRSKLGKVTRYGNVGQETHGGSAGEVLTVEFELNGMKFVALNGGPIFKFTEAVSVQIMCDTQVEIDYYWKKLTRGGGAESQCGWLKDKYGFSWQVTPKMLVKLIGGSDRKKADRAMAAMMKMGKIDIRTIEKAVAAK